MNYLKKTFFLLLMSCIPWIGYAQKSRIQSLPEEKKFDFNPAYAGMAASLDIIGWTRSQWENIPGSPRNYALQAHVPAYVLKGGLGMRLATDESGPFFKFSLDLDYSYVQETSWGYINGGLGLGFRQLSFDGRSLRTLDGIYDEFNFQHNDPVLLESSLQGGQLFSRLGVMVLADDWEVGLSVDDLFSTQSTFSVGDKDFDWAYAPQFHIFGQYTLELNDLFDLSPVIYAIADKNHLQTLTKVKVTYDEKYFFNLGVRGNSKNTLESIVAGFGMQFSENWRVIYSYDIGLNSIAQRGSGSHELVLRYNLNKRIGGGVRPPIIEHPRYF